VVSTDTMLGGAATCARLSELNLAVKTAAHTVLMQDDVTTWLEHVDYFGDLKTLVGDAAATDEDLNNAAIEIEAARVAGEALAITLSST